MTAPCVLRLVERRPCLARLRRDDLDFLLAHHRTHLDVQPTHRRGVYRLTPRGFVGVIAAPGRRIEIAPKIPLANVLHLLDPDDAIWPADAPESRPDAGALVELLAGRFAALLAGRVAAGLQSGYVEREELLPHLRGRLDVAAQLREAARDRLHCRFEDFTLDAPWNRQVKAVAALLLAAPMTGEAARAAVRQSLAAFAEVGDEPASDVTLAMLLADPGLAEYRPLLDMSRLLRSALDPGGDGMRAAFLIDLERAFERYVTRGLRQAFAGSDIQVQAQPAWTFHEPAPWPPLSLRPDLVLRRDGRPLVVIDAKWKRFADAPEPDDLHQALAYAAALGAPRVILAYPGPGNRRRDYQLSAAPVRLGLHRLRLRGPRESCRAALECWAEMMVRSGPSRGA